MRRHFFALVLVVFSLAIYVGTATAPALFDDVDAAHAEASREMLERGDWAVMHINGIRYLEKAPIHYWLVAASYALLGKNEFATRLPLALAVAGLVLMVYAFGRRFFNELVGFYAGLVICTSVGMFLFTRIMVPEALYALEFTAAFYLFLRAWTGTLSQRVGYWGCAVLIALAVLTRGLIGVVLPTGIIFFFLLITGGWRRWRELRLVSSALVFLLIAAPWHLIVGLRNHGFFWYYFINGHVLRAIGTRYPQDSIYMPLFSWYAAHLVWFFPWSLFLPYTAREFPRLRAWRRIEESDGQARILLFTWAGFILLFFSLTKRGEHYSFGAWPAIALLLGLGLARAEREHSRWLPRLQGALAVLGVLVAAGLSAWLLIPRATHVEGDLSNLLLLGEDWFTRKSAVTFFRLTQSISGLRLPAFLAIISFIVGLGGAWLLRYRRRADRNGPLANALMALAMAGFFFAATLSMKVFEPYMSSRSLAHEIERHLGPQDDIVLYGDFYLSSSVRFYSDREALIYNGRYNNGLEFGSYYPDAPQIFLTDNDFPALWRGSRQVFLFVPQQLHNDALGRLPANSTYLLAESGGKSVYVNQPLTPGQPTLARLAMQRNHPASR